MGLLNIGNQLITYNFKYPGKSEDFNKVNYNIMPNGVYDGGTVTRVNNTTVSIAPITVYIKDPVTEISLRVTKTDATTVTVSEINTYIVCSFDWTGSISDSLVFEAMPFASIESKHIIIANCSYYFDSGYILSDTFDLTKRDEPYISRIKDDVKELIVQSTEPFSNKVLIKAGQITTVNKEIDIPDTLSPAVSNTTTHGRIDLVYYDGTNVRIEEGTPSATPVAPNYQSKLVLSEISRGANKSYITQADITNIKRENFDLSEISTAGSTTGAFLIHAGEHGDLNDGNDLQTAMINLLDLKGIPIIDAEYGEEISKNDPVGANADGTYWLSGESIVYDEKPGGTNYNLNTNGHRDHSMVVLNNKDYLILAWIDSSDDLTAIGVYDNGTSLEWSNTFKITGTFSEVDLCSFGNDYFVLATVEDGASYHGYVRVCQWDKSGTNNLVVLDGPTDISHTTGNAVSEVTVDEMQNYPLSETSYFVVGMMDWDYNYNPTPAFDGGYDGVSVRLCKFSGGSITKYDIVVSKFASRSGGGAFWNGYLQIPEDRTGDRQVIVKCGGADSTYKYAYLLVSNIQLAYKWTIPGSWEWLSTALSYGDQWQIIENRWNGLHNGESEISDPLYCQKITTAENFIGLTSNDEDTRFAVQYAESYYKGIPEYPVNVASVDHAKSYSHQYYQEENDSLLIGNSTYYDKVSSFNQTDTNIIDTAIIGSTGCTLLEKDSKYYLLFHPLNTNYNYQDTLVYVTLLDSDGGIVPVRILNYKNYICILYKDSNDSNFLRLLFYQRIGYEGIAMEDGYNGETHPVQIGGKYYWGSNALDLYNNYYYNSSTQAIDKNGSQYVGFAINENELFLD